MSAVFAQLASVIATATGVPNVYVIGNQGVRALPDAINDTTPAILIYPEELTSNEQIPNSLQRLMYTITLQVLVGGADLPSKAATALPLIDNILAVLAVNSTLTQTCVWVRMTRAKFGVLLYGGTEYLGWDCTLDVMEELAVNFA